MNLLPLARRMRFRTVTRLGRLASACLIAASALASAAEPPKADYKPLSIHGLYEIGAIERGMLTARPQIIRGEWLDHFGVFMTQSLTLEERTRIDIGLGGVFVFPKDERVGEVFGGSQYKMFYFGPSVAKAMYDFGDPSDPYLSLGGGMFPFKYNDDASNLGEYLFRSAPYPNYLLTGGVTAIGSSSAYVQGFHGRYRTGGFTVDALALTETSMAPLYDWSLGLVGTWRSENRVFEASLGANWQRAIKVHSDATDLKLKDTANMYFEYAGKDFVGNSRYYTEPMNFLKSKIKSVAPTDPRIAVWQQRLAADSIVYAQQQAGLKDSTIAKSFYDPSGLMLMARASLDFKTLFGIERGSPRDARLYVEAALLGVKNYPVYYTKISERLPVLMGFNVPTFGWLDLLSLEVEYYNSPHIGSNYQIGKANIPIPDFKDGGNLLYSDDEYLDFTKRDNIAWSVLVQKKILGALTLSAQAARDHMRTVGTDWYYGSRFEPNDVLHEMKDWYWMVQIGWGI